MKKISKILVSAATATAMLFLGTPIVYAVTTPIQLRPTEVHNLGTITIESLINNGVKLILILAAVFFFFFLVLGGIQWMISGGDKAGAETARKRVTAALVGLAIVFSAWAIATLFKTLFGFDIFGGFTQIPQFYQ